MKLSAEDTSKVLAAVSAGRIVFIGEWRGSKPETINYTSKTTGQAASFSRVQHTVEIGEGDRVEAFKVSERVPDRVKPEDMKAPAKKGQRVLVEVQSIVQDKGNVVVNATSISPLVGT